MVFNLHQINANQEDSKKLLATKFIGELLYVTPFDSIHSAMVGKKSANLRLFCDLYTEETICSRLFTHRKNSQTDLGCVGHSKKHHRLFFLLTLNLVYLILKIYMGSAHCTLLSSKQKRADV